MVRLWLFLVVAVAALASLDCTAVPGRGGNSGGGGAGDCIAGGAVSLVGTQFATSVPVSTSNIAVARRLCNLAAEGAGLPPDFIPSVDTGAWSNACGYTGPSSFEPVGGCPGPGVFSCRGEWDEHGRERDAGARSSMLCLARARMTRPPVQGTGKRFFVTREEWSGNLGGLQGADGRCRDVAADAGLPSPWLFRAFLGVGLVDAAARFRDGGPWSTAAGRVVFRNGASFATTPIVGLVDDEFSDSLDGGVLWTGSSTWLTATGLDCAGWTSASDAGSVGFVGATDETWINGGERSCATSARLLCLEQ